MGDAGWTPSVGLEPQARRLQASPHLYNDVEYVSGGHFYNYVSKLLGKINYECNKRALCRLAVPSPVLSIVPHEEVMKIATLIIKQSSNV